MKWSFREIFSIGIGPSSSHTVGPMKAAKIFLESLNSLGKLQEVETLSIELYGSLALTGIGHGTDSALIWGLEGETPQDLKITEGKNRIKEILENKLLFLLGNKNLPLLFDIKRDIVYQKTRILPLHSNGMIFKAHLKSSALFCETFYSIGGGHIATEQELKEVKQELNTKEQKIPPFPYFSGANIISFCNQNKISFYDLLKANEIFYYQEKWDEPFKNIWEVLVECLNSGLLNSTQTFLPGPLKARRRAFKLFQQITSKKVNSSQHSFTLLDWSNVFSLAISEQNAAGERIVTAPTNGAAGIIPAVFFTYLVAIAPTPFISLKREDISTRLLFPSWELIQEQFIHYCLVCAGIGLLYKMNASVSGAEVGCQGEIGVASSMAAAGLCALMGGHIEQIENAAEVAMEHHLGLTCDPIGGLVQIPCIERNTMGTLKAINAAQLAIGGDGSHIVSLDSVIKTMKQTGEDMGEKYKETSRGGLAVFVNLPEC